MVWAGGLAQEFMSTTEMDEARMKVFRIRPLFYQWPLMVSTIKEGTGSAKSTYLRNHTFKSPVTRTDTRS